MGSLLRIIDLGNLGMPAFCRGQYSRRCSLRLIERKRQLPSESILLSASSRGRYSRRRSPRPIEHQQLLPSEQVLFPSIWCSSRRLAALDCAGEFPQTCYLACSLRRASLRNPYSRSSSSSTCRVNSCRNRELMPCELIPNFC